MAANPKAPEAPATFDGARWAATHQASVDTILAGTRDRRQVISRGSRFYNRDAWTARFMLGAMIEWAQRNPGQKPTWDDVDRWVTEGNKARVDQTGIVIAATPRRLSKRIALALAGGGHHEAFHTLYSCRRRITTHEVWQIVEPRWDKADWSKLGKLLQEFCDIIEDVRIERRGCEEFPGVSTPMADLQDFVLGQEHESRRAAIEQGASLEDVITPLTAITCTFRDIGLGYNTRKVRAAIEERREVQPEAHAVVVEGPLRPVLQDAIDLGRDDDVGYLRVSMDAVIALRDLADSMPEQAQQQAGEMACPSCGAPPTKLRLRPLRVDGKRVKGKGVIVCTVCGHQEEIEFDQNDSKDQEPDENATPIQAEDWDDEDESEGDDDQEQSGGGSGDESDDADEGEGDSGEGDEDGEGGEDQESGGGSGDESEDGDDDQDSDASGDGEGDDEDSEADSDGGDSGEGDEDGEGGEDQDSKGGSSGDSEGDDAEGSDTDGDDGDDADGDDADGDDADGDDGDSEGEGSEDGGGDTDGDDAEGSEDGEGDDEIEATEGTDESADGGEGGKEGAEAGEQDKDPWSDAANDLLEAAESGEESGRLDQADALGEAFEDARDDESDDSGDAQWCPYDPGADTVLFPPTTKRDNQVAKDYCAAVKREVAFLRARLRNIVRAAEMVEVEHGVKKARKLSNRTLVHSRGCLKAGRYPNRAYQEGEVAIDTSVAAAISLDQSGSTSHIRQDLIKAMFAIAEPIEQIGGASMAFGWRDGSSRSRLTREETNDPLYRKAHRHGGMTFDVFKTFEEKFQIAKARFVKATSTGGTPMADGVEFGLRALSDRPEGHRILFVITDGHPNGNHRRIIPSQLRRAKKAGIIVIGVGVGEGTEYVKTVFPDSVYAPDISQLPKLLVAKINKLLDFSERKRGKRLAS